ncbi:MAG: tetratricopeptide repeat protein, partial [Elusimicrobiota bacterium]
DYIVGNLSNYLAEFNPDIVVTMMGVNDRWDDLAVLQYTHGPWYSALRTYKLVKLIGLHAKEKMKSWHSIRSQLSDNTVFSGGKTVDEQSNKSESEKMFQSVLAINPRNDNTFVMRAGLYRAQKRYDESEKMIQGVLSINPRNDDAFVEMARLYSDQHRYGESEKMIQSALAINPRNDQAFVAMAQIYGAQKRYDESEKMFQSALAINPRNEDAIIEMARSYGEQKRYDESEKVFQQALEINPHNKDVMIWMLKLYYDMGKFDKGIEITAALIQRNNINALQEGVTVRIRHLSEGKSANVNYSVKTQNNYRELRNILEMQHIKLISVEYPMRPVQPLMDMLSHSKDIVFVDNEKSFKDGVKIDGYDAYFVDNFEGSFGHCTYKGNRLLAENIADAIINKYFLK